MRLKIAFILLLSFTLTVAAHADSLKNSLEQQYKKHVLSLRAPFSKGDQKFDSAGKSLNPPKGQWLTYGGIYVEQFDLSPENLRIHGRRVGINREKDSHKTTLVAESKSLEIEIHLDKPLQSMEEAQAILDRIFYLKDANMEHAKPEYRRSDDTTVDEPIYSVKDGVTPPTATYTPEPEFSEAARRAKFQGTVLLNIVVDKSGNITRIKLQRALGYGLDENAMEGVKKWRFQPGMREGQPVAVSMSIEISFNLY